MRLRAVQEGERIWPIVWHNGRYVSVPPLSPLHLRIGFEGDGPQLASGAGDADAEAELRAAPKSYGDA